jgi:hypothetical protein
MQTSAIRSIFRWLLRVTVVLRPRHSGDRDLRSPPAVATCGGCAFRLSGSDSCVCRCRHVLGTWSRILSIAAPADLSAFPIGVHLASPSGRDRCGRSAPGRRDGPSRLLDAAYFVRGRPRLLRQASAPSAPPPRHPMNSDSLEGKAPAEDSSQKAKAALRTLILCPLMMAVLQTFWFLNPRPQGTLGDPWGIGKSATAAWGLATVLEIVLAVGLLRRARWAWRASFGFFPVIFLLIAIAEAPRLYASDGWGAIVPLLAIAGIGAWWTVQWRKALHQAKEVFPQSPNSQR